jgi:hypothetical protein
MAVLCAVVIRHIPVDVIQYWTSICNSSYAYLANTFVVNIKKNNILTCNTFLKNNFYDTTN